MYHLHMPPREVRRMPILERKYYIEKFVDQKKRENESIEKERRKAKSRR